MTLQIPHSVEQLLDTLIPGITNALGDELVGIYLWGSTTLHAFDEGVSDVDLVVCVRSVPDDALVARMRPIHAAIDTSLPAWRNRVEVAYVEVHGLRSFRDRAHPIARISPGEPLNLRDADAAWLIDWFQIRDSGVALVGPQPVDVFPEISIDELRATATQQLREWPDAPSPDAAASYLGYVALLFARGRYAIETGAQTTKAAAGAWLADADPRWAPLMRAAIAARMGEPFDAAALTPDTVEAFTRATKLVAAQ